MSVLWLGDPGSDQVETAGGKAASLSRMVQAGLPVPPGYVVTAGAYRRAVAESGLAGAVRQRLAAVPPGDLQALEQSAGALRELVRAAPLCGEIREEIAGAYGRLGRDRSGLPVAVRSSATAEDLADASFAGQQDTYLGVTGAAAVVDRVRDCWASLFTARAVLYRRQKGFDHLDAAVAVVVQELVDAEKAGVMFTTHPVTGDAGTVVIEAVWGLGEALVSGEATPDNYTAEKAGGRVTDRFVFAQESMIVRDAAGGTRPVPVPPDRRKVPVLTDDEIAALAAVGRQLEAFFGGPQDVEWAVAEGRFYLLQSRPITTL